ncbi:MAG TPA: DMT family transporter [Firmicutes bacterium]|nr:DMT family transporter [Bacillota bacterium]
MAVTLIWGSTFPLVKSLVAYFDPMVLIATRFTVAAILMALGMLGRLRRLDRHTLIAGAVLGGFLFSGYVLQTVGLKYTTASKAGFITGLSVVMVPFLSKLILNRPPRRAALIGAALAALGLGSMTMEPGSSLVPQVGDMLVLLCALGFALHIVFVGRYAPVMDVPLLVLVQVATTAVIGIAYTAVTGQLGPVFRASELGIRSWLSILYLGAFATAGAFFVQNAAQRVTSPTRVAIILATEPIFSAIFAWLWLGESLGRKGVIGALLILVGMLIAELEVGFKKGTVEGL